MPTLEDLRERLRRAPVLADNDWDHKDGTGYVISWRSVRYRISYADVGMAILGKDHDDDIAVALAETALSIAGRFPPTDMSSFRGIVSICHKIVQFHRRNWR